MLPQNFLREIAEFPGSSPREVDPNRNRIKNAHLLTSANCIKIYGPGSRDGSSATGR
jgi:hypothetical protein